MDTLRMDRFLRILEIAESDPEFLELSRQLYALDSRITPACAHLSEAEHDLLLDYLNVYGASWGRIVEIACDMMDFID